MKDPEIIDAITELCIRSHKTAIQKGFWPDKDGGIERNKGELIALMHSELSELLEAIRTKGGMRVDEHCPAFVSEEIELADLFIRAFDYAQAFGLRLGEAILAKMAFNETRPSKHGKEF